MQSSSIAKACVIPVCGNEKFSLVHKFPADKERFNEWLEAVQKSDRIEKFSGLTPEAIRKRFFVCSRHFGLKEYKNVESRGLNLTAVPHLNLENLNEIKLSKAWQIKQSSSETPKNTPESSVVQKPISNIRILNSEVSKASSGNTVPEVKPSPVTTPQKAVEVLSEDEFEIIQDSPTQPPAKRVKRVSNESGASPKLDSSNDRNMRQKRNEIAKAKKPVKSKEVVKPQVVVSKVLKKEPGDLPEEELSTGESKPQNKLLALIEVTPEQYDKLNKSMTTTERSENVTSLINFINNEELDLAQADNEIEISLEDDKVLKLDLFWLRDHCRCDSCYNHSTHQRKLNILDISDDIAAKTYEVKGEKLRVVWDDKHESLYNIDFLLKNQPMEIFKSQPLALWNKESMVVPLKSNCRVSMRDYMSDPDVSKKVLENLHVYGIAFIDGVQPTQQNTEFVIRQLFPIHKTLFGEMWTFSDAKKDHSDTAYTNFYLGPHNDNTYFNDAAGLQILHCINESCVGGENFLIDGFQVAQKIKDNHPEVFKRLTTTIITGEYIEDGHHHKYSSPIINLSPNGEIEQVRFNLYDRAPFKSVPFGKIRQFYSDLKVLSREFEDLGNRITFKLKPGTVMIFDNWRVLHGRMAYTGKRTMTGCYVARTEFQSTLRVNSFIE